MQHSDTRSGRLFPETDRGQGRLQYYFSGRVQGVGFRYIVNNIAMRFDVDGYVRNLADGRVEVVMEGDRQQMEHLLDEVRQKMQGFIHREHRIESPATGEFSQFRIRH